MIWVDIVYDYDKLQVQFFIIEFIFLLEIILKCFVIKSEDVIKRANLINSARITAMSYYNDDFWSDFLIWFPWYTLLDTMGVGHYIQIINTIKCFRLKVLNKFLNDRELKIKCEKMFDVRFK